MQAIPSSTDTTRIGTSEFDHQALLLGIRRTAPRPKRVTQRHELTSEQTLVVDTAKSGCNISVNAFAGTGKTATAVAAANALQQKGLYLAFGHAIASEARQRFPSNVEVTTFHGLAYTQLGIQRWCERAGRKLGEPSLHAISSWLGISGVEASLQAWRLREVLRRFQQTAATNFDQRLITPAVLLSLEQECGGSTVPGENDALRRTIDALLMQAKALWDAVWRADDPARLAVSHDAYLKRWAMTSPALPGDFHLVDEAQDCSPLMVELLSQQDRQRVLLGDKHQSIFGFRGAVNAMACLPAESRTLTRSFRFGACIEMVANHVLQLAGETAWLTGDAATPGDLFDPDCGLEAYLEHVDGPLTILTRTNSEALSLATALVNRYPTAVVGGLTEMLILLRSALGLLEGRIEEVRCPRLRPFRSWASLCEHARRSGDAELQQLVALVELRRFVLARQLVDLEIKLKSESDARVLISTVHKAKGREWDHVFLADDFKSINRDPVARARQLEEINLIYVAVTRARHSLRMNVALQSILDSA